MAGNVFGLNEVYDLQKDNATDLDLNIPGLGYGYLLAGEFPVITTVDRYDLATETMSQPGTNLPQGRAQHQSFADPNNYGYYGGGYNGPPAVFFSNTFRYDFSNETITDISQNAPDGNRNRRARLYNPSYGYFVGGSPSSKIDRLDFSTQTYTSPGNLPSVNSWPGTTSSPSYGYVGGGETPSLTCTIQRMDFSVETFSSPGGLPTSVGQICQTIESNTTGYWGGGYISGGTTCHIERLDFSTEVASKNPGYMSIKRSRGSAIKSPNFGYFCNGNTPSYISTISRLDFSTDTVSDNPPVGRSAAGRASFEINRPQVFKFVPGNNVWKESPNQGFYGSGQDASSNALSTISKIDFSSETLSNPSATTTTSPIFMIGTQNSNYGYYVNGYDSTNNHCTVNRFDFSNETLVNSAAKTNRATRGAGGVESKDYAYFGGGYGPGNLSTIDRMDFSTEVTSLPGTFISQARGGLCGSNNENYGYFAGGTNSPIPTLHNCRIDRIDFSTETVTNPPVSLSDDKRFVGGFESQSYGYFAGGSAPSAAVDAGCRSNIDKMDFSSETLERLSAQLSVKRDLPGATSNFAYGYIGGGRVFPPTTIRVSTIDRLDFISDTISTPSSTLPSARSAAVGVSGGISTRRVGGATDGYFAGGRTATYESTIDRLEFATETVGNRSTFAQLPAAKAYITSTYNSNYGYFAGGQPGPGTTALCTIDRLDFSNETIAGAHTSVPVLQMGGAGVQNSNYGYFGGGNTPPGGGFNSDIERLDFSTESTSLPGNHLTKNRYLPGAVQSSSHGYFGGGGSQPSPAIYECTIDRFDFTTETATDLGDSLDNGILGVFAVKTNNYGYFAGGTRVPAPDSICVINRLDFTTETVSTTSGQLSQNRYGGGSASSINYGYFVGGVDFNVSTIDRLDFAAETVSVPFQKLTQGRNVMASVQND